MKPNTTKLFLEIGGYVFRKFYYYYLAINYKFFDICLLLMK